MACSGYALMAVSYTHLEVYKDAFATGRRNLVLMMLSRNVDYYRLAEIFVDYKKEMLKTEAERKALYKEDKRNDFYNTITNLYNSYMPDLEPQILNKILTDASTFEECKGLEPFKSFASVSYTHLLWQP